MRAGLVGKPPDDGSAKRSATRDCQPGDSDGVKPRSFGRQATERANSLTSNRVWHCNEQEFQHVR